MFRSLSWSRIRLSLQRDISITRYALANVIETMRGMMRNFLGHLMAPIAALKVLREITQAVQLVENGHHEAGAVVVAIYSYMVGLRQIVRAIQIRYHDVAATFGAEWDPVVQGVECRGFVEEHVLACVLGVAMECVHLAWNLYLLAMCLVCVFLFNIRSGTGDLRSVFEGGARKNSKNTMVTAIAISSITRMYDHARAQLLRRLVFVFEVCCSAS